MVSFPHLLGCSNLELVVVMVSTKVVSILTTEVAVVEETAVAVEEMVVRTVRTNREEKVLLEVTALTQTKVNLAEIPCHCTAITIIVVTMPALNEKKVWKILNLSSQK